MTAIAALGDLAEFIRGVTFKPEQVSTSDDVEAVACLRTKNVQAQLETSDLVFVPRSVVKNEAQMVRHGDIVISSANSWNLVGKSSWVGDLDFEAAIGGFICLLRVTRDDVDARYLYRWFSSPRIQAIVRSFGQKTTNISNLNLGRARELEVPLPPLPEQRRIAAILDQADELRTKRRRALQLLDELADAIFVDMFGTPSDFRGELMAFGELGRVVTGKTPPGAREGMFGDFVPFVTPGDLGRELTPGRGLSQAGSATVPLVASGSLLVCCIGATIGKIGMAAEPSGFNQQINAVEWGPLVDSTFGLFATRQRRDEIVHSASSTTMPILNKGAFQKIQIAIPKIEHQKAFATQIGVLMGHKSASQYEEVLLDELFASLQHRAFRGEL
ncbi:restriction endonuclease subunit S [Cryobacterium sp. Hh38]|uniref:restriction endonuclease subunit S n=1 Tax=Cryobacterium sp. Hh38 TaxID=1259156 RepID=UPI0010696256|nr:restriction endonuclease subunit S [Cryobacterium sp. Hh38]TFD66085.1 restriction endonuclease subunit S [Cryobacterium sp. Hh38]